MWEDLGNVPDLAKGGAVSVATAEIINYNVKQRQRSDTVCVLLQHAES